MTKYVRNTSMVHSHNYRLMRLLARTQKWRQLNILGSTRVCNKILHYHIRLFKELQGEDKLYQNFKASGNKGMKKLLNAFDCPNNSKRQINEG